MKIKISAVCLAACLSFGASVFGTTFDYANTTGSVIQFAGDGTFTISPNKNNTEITDGTAAGLVAEITGTYTIGIITTAGSLSVAPVTGIGTMVIHDGANDLTATVQWIDIAQSGTLDFLNTSATVNLTGISYAGSNPDLVALKNAGSAVNAFSFQFVPGVLLSDLKSSSHFTSFSGTISFCSGQIGDFVWQDTNQNGCQDPGEPGIANVQVDLYSGCGTGMTFVKSTSTDANGKYLFDNLCAGQYTVLFRTPSGYNHTLAHQTCSVGGLPSNETDSDCDCTGNTDCAVCVTLPDNTSDLSIDCGYIPSNPQLQLIKTVSPTTAKPGQPVTYSYLVTNSGPITVTNINIIDDNGTPVDTSDDYYVNPAPFDLGSGEGKSFTIPHIAEPMCVSVGGSNLFVGTLTVNVLGSGDIEVFYNQSQSLNDNRYGTGATAATGWKNGHKFSDLVNSDQATFLFTDGAGKAVLEFQCDYISQATSAKFGDGVTISYPAGYGTLGPNGGDGKMLIGAASNVLSAHSTLSDTLNQAPAFYGFKTNSPPETAPLSNVSIPAGWNYTDGYHVIVSKRAFGANGFGNVTIPLVHDSPPKNGLDKVVATNVCDCVTNTAYAFGVQITGLATNIVAEAYDNAEVCFNGSSGGTLSTLGGTVWNDGNKDGIFQSTEKGMGGVNVALLDCSNHQLATTKTDKNGKYQFANLAAGQYEIKFTLPPGQHFSPTGGDSDANVTTGLTTCITLPAGVTDLSWNAGMHK